MELPKRLKGLGLETSSSREIPAAVSGPGLLAFRQVQD